eukprot:5236292-Amphidinium_carterae.1
MRFKSAFLSMSLTLRRQNNLGEFGRLLHVPTWMETLDFLSRFAACCEGPTGCSIVEADSNG